ncbi:amino acid ABC transporter permease [Clostridium sp. AN503]|uniref:amino acid ABC transporter permease n=1 Tax=Clostridium sp. AN503 TaxID=3160598 RepID=UPI0034579F03
MIKDLFDVKRWEAFLKVLPTEYIPGFIMTLKVALAGLLLALALGVIFGMLSTTKVKFLKFISRVYVEFFQNTPLVVQVFFYYACLPYVIGGRIPKFTLGVIGVGIYHGAYISEVIRTGIEAVPKGQFEAAYSQGFNYLQTMCYIILPQTMKMILPPLTNQALNLVKNTSVLAMVAGMDLMYHADSWGSDRGYFVQAYLPCALLYFAICFPLARLARYLEIRAKRTPVPKKQKGVA